MADNSFKVQKGVLNLKPLSSAPSNPELGDVYYDSNTNSLLQWNGSAFESTGQDALDAHAADTTTHGTTGDIVGTSDSQTLTNKTIDSDSNIITNIVDADIKSTAAIARSKIAAGTSNHVIVNDGSGNLSSEASLAATRGGTGQSSYAVGDLLYADTTTTLTKLSPGTSGKFLRSNGSGSAPSYESVSGAATNESELLENLSLAASVASNALTISLKDQAGSDPSGSSQIRIGFRNSIAATGTYNIRSVSSSLSVTVSSGSTLGFTAGFNEYVYIYAIDNSGTVELAVVGGAHLMDEGSLVSSTAEGGAGGADTRYTLYSTTARTNVPIRLIGRMKFNLSTAGTWDSIPSEISIAPFQQRNIRSEIWVDTVAGTGVVSTQVLRWTNNSKSIGSAMTYTDDSNYGGYIRIQEEGIYNASASLFKGASGESLAVGLNAVGTVAASSLTVAARMFVVSMTGGSNLLLQGSATTRLKPGDYIDIHYDTGPDASNALSEWRVIKIAD
jgi:hypothetical protein